MAQAAVQSAAASSMTWATTARAASPAAPSSCHAAWMNPPAPLPAPMTKMVGASASCAAPQASSLRHSSVATG
eukprot:11131744-Alexandrium_andersonii.AAC.1